MAMKDELELKKEEEHAVMLTEWQSPAGTERRCQRTALCDQVVADPEVSEGRRIVSAIPCVYPHRHLQFESPPQSWKMKPSLSHWRSK